MGTTLGLPIMRIVVYWGLYWGSSFFFEQISNEAVELICPEAHVAMLQPL